MKRAIVALVLPAALAACGDEDSTTTQRTESPSLAPTAQATPTAEPDEPTATAPSAPPPPADATGPEDPAGGSGADEVARTRVRVVVDGEGITPPRVEAPAFLPLRITVRNDLPRRLTVTLRAERRTVIAVRARSTRSVDVGGLGRGDYPLAAGDAGRAVIAVR